MTHTKNIKECWSCNEDVDTDVDEIVTVHDEDWCLDCADTFCHCGGHVERDLECDDCSADRAGDAADHAYEEARDRMMDL
jgi:hypothetical protein